jgi:tRNA A-37 threonylcarbamoyl transferase component Bud32
VQVASPHEAGAVALGASPTPPVAAEPLSRYTLSSTTDTLPGAAPPPRKPEPTGSASQSRPARAVLYDSASQPDTTPLLQSRLRVIALIGIFVSVAVALLVPIAHWQNPSFDARAIGFAHAGAIALNLGIFAILSLQRALPCRLIFVLHHLCFIGNAVLFVTLPTLELGIGAHLYNAAAIIVLIRAVFIPCNPKHSLIFGLVLWSFYPATVLAGAGFVPLLAAELADPAMRAAFIMGNFNIGLHLALALVAVHYFHGLRMRAFQAEQAGSYRLLDKLGEGGMGEVYRARHALLSRPTAVKMLRADQIGSATALKRFEREVRAVSELSHPNTISIYDFGKTEAGRFYYAMEYLEGLDLQKLVERYGPLDPARGVHILDQVLGSLGEAHWRGILHRDIKPSNIFLTVRGRLFDFAKVLDFGLVKEVGPDPQFTAGLTSDGSITGTPLYMAPERFYGDTEVDHRSDLYAVGALAYFLLTGRPVFDVKNPMQALIDHARTPPVPPRDRGAPISEELEQAILRALEKDPAHRFETAEHFAAALQATPEWGKWSRQSAQLWWSNHLPDASSAASQPITPGA